MKLVRLGKTGLMVTKPSMGCLPLQRRSVGDAVKLLRRAYDAGINFYDTANMYTDSEEKLGAAFEGIRENVMIATKSTENSARGVLSHIELSLRRMRTDYIDLFQFHNVRENLDINDPDGPYAGALDAKKRGLVRHIGVTAHRLDVAFELVKSGNYETMQYPFSYLASDREVELVRLCSELDVGYIAMKGLAGGLARSARAAHAFMEDFENVVPIWGVQHMGELEEWLSFAGHGVKLDDELLALIKEDRESLGGNFCRSCGYCTPCPADIEISNCARMDMLLRRSPWEQYYTDEWRAKMEKINDCIQCGQCRERCPFGLDIPSLLSYMLDDYHEYYRARTASGK